MRKILLKYYGKLLFNEKYNNNVYLYKLRNNIINILTFLLFPEFRNISNNIIFIFDNFKRIIIFFIIFISLILLSYFIGYKISRIDYNNLNKKYNYNILIIDSLKNTIYEKDSIMKYKFNELKSRDYIEYKIINKCKIKHIHELKSLPDSIFFLIINESDKYNIPYEITFRLIERESKFKFIKNKSGSGAFGYMQLMPATFEYYYKKLKLHGGHTPENNIKVGLYYLYTIKNFWKTQFKNENKAWEYALSEYACGRSKMICQNGYIIPNYVKNGIEYVISKYYINK